MKTLYIDHSIVSSHEPSWEPVRRTIAAGKVRLALSVWNLYEIAEAADEAQRERRLAFFVDGMRPVWVVERLVIQRQEVERFLWQHKFGAAPRDLIVITSVVDSFYAGSRTRIGLTARRLIHEANFQELRPLKCLSRDALKSLQSADTKRRKLMERKVFNKWIGRLLPERGPSGRALTIPEKADLLEFCWRHKKQFFFECRCLAAEDALTDARISDPMRRPSESDGPDLQHAAVALPYCDIFYSRDGFQTQCAASARKALVEKKGLSAVSVICSTTAQLMEAVAAA